MKESYRSRETGATGQEKAMPKKKRGVGIAGAAALAAGLYAGHEGLEHVANTPLGALHQAQGKAPLEKGDERGDLAPNAKAIRPLFQDGGKLREAFQNLRGLEARAQDDLAWKEKEAEERRNAMAREIGAGLGQEFTASKNGYVYMPEMQNMFLETRPTTDWFDAMKKYMEEHAGSGTPVYCVEITDQGDVALHRFLRSVYLPPADPPVHDIEIYGAARAEEGLVRIVPLSQNGPSEPLDLPPDLAGEMMAKLAEVHFGEERDISRLARSRNAGEVSVEYYEDEIQRLRTEYAARSREIYDTYDRMMNGE